MGMSTHIVGFKDRTEHDKHVKIWKMCKQAGVSLPKETAAYFDFGKESEDFNPNHIDEYQIEEMLETDLGNCVEMYNAEMCEGYEVHVDRIPKHVKRIRFYNSY